MRQLTDAEKQQLEAKIGGERQKTLLEKRLDIRARSARIGFVLDHISKYGMLAIILYLIAWNVMHLLKSRDFAYDEYGNLVIALMLLFNHITYNFTKTGWKGRVMKAVAWIWMVFGSFYIFWVL